MNAQLLLILPVKVGTDTDWPQRSKTLGHPESLNETLLYCDAAPAAEHGFVIEFLGIPEEASLGFLFSRAGRVVSTAATVS